MVTAMLTKRSRRTRICKRNRGSAMAEALEQRQMFSLVGVSLQNPIFFSDYPDLVNYNASYAAGKGLLTSNTTIYSVFQDAPNPASYDLLPADIVAGGVHLQFLVNTVDGTFGGHNPLGAEDLDVFGKVTLDGTTYDGSVTPLLKGNVTAFGFDEVSGSVFDVRLTITGGQLATNSHYLGQDLAMVLTLNPSVDQPANPFQANFTTQTKTFMSPTTPTTTTPKIVTNAGPSVVVGSGTQLTDSATLSNGNNPTGTITFTLFDPASVSVVTNTVAVNGNGTYVPSAGYTPTTVGTYVWSAVYSGDAKNLTVADDGKNENEAVTKATPCLVTKASITYKTNPCGNVAGSAIPQDQAVLSGGYNVTGGTLTFVLKAPDGSTVDTEILNVNGVGTYKTNNKNAATQVGTYTWYVTYSGDTLNLSVQDQGGPAEQVTIGAAGSISGRKLLDNCGDGLTSDDTIGIGGVTIKLFIDSNSSNGLDSGDVLVGTTTTAAGTGAYSFNNLVPGKYFIQEVVPTGYLQTGPSSGTYTVTVASGDKKTGFDFDNFKICDCKDSFTCISYIINGCKTVTDLTGNVHQGDTVKVVFTLSETETVSLVSYTAPESYFVADHAPQQKIFDVDTQTFGPGTHCLTVVVPDCFYQIDFICGCPITTLGTNPNVFYTPQNRLLDADNGGTSGQCNFVTNCNSSGCISGTVYCDNNNNGRKDSGEGCISNCRIILTGTCNSGEKVKLCLNTDSNGNYKFTGLKAGCYKISEDACDTYLDGKDSCGTYGATVYNDVISNLNLSSGGTSSGNNFAELETSSISGVVYKDSDRTNTLTTNDKGLAGIKITLSGYNDLGTYITVVTYTDSYGKYTFDGLRSGSYTLTETQPYGYSSRTNNVGTAGGYVSGDSFKSIALGWATDATSYNFGEA